MTRAAARKREAPQPGARICETILRAERGARTLYRFDVWTTEGDTDRCTLTLTAEGPLGRLRALAELETLGYSVEYFEPAERPRKRTTVLVWELAATLTRLRAQGII
jgi:hypothetical protein